MNTYVACAIMVVVVYLIFMVVMTERRKLSEYDNMLDWIGRRDRDDINYTLVVNGIMRQTFTGTYQQAHAWYSDNKDVDVDISFIMTGASYRLFETMENGELRLLIDSEYLGSGTWYVKPI